MTGFCKHGNEHLGSINRKEGDKNVSRRLEFAKIKLVGGEMRDTLISGRGDTISFS